MNLEKNDQIQQAHCVFDHHHHRLRGELLARLAREHAAAPGATARQHPRHLPLGKWILGSALGVAAMLLVALISWRLLAPSNPAANRSLVSSPASVIKSVFVRGWYDERESRPRP
jgi:hypothetical protein